MRDKIYSEFKNYFRCELLRARDQAGRTQEEMAVLLEMSPRAYADLESGRSCCSTVTLLLSCTAAARIRSPFSQRCSGVWTPS